MYTSPSLLALVLSLAVPARLSIEFLFVRRQALLNALGFFHITNLVCQRHFLLQLPLSAHALRDTSALHHGTQSLHFRLACSCSLSFELHSSLRLESQRSQCTLNTTTYVSTTTTTNNNNIAIIVSMWGSGQYAVIDHPKNSTLPASS